MVSERPTTPRARAAAPRASSDVDTSDWPAQAADAIEKAVQGVRDKTTGPAITAARWVVAGLFVLIAGTMALILLAIGLVRVLDAYLPSAVFGDEHVWAAHALVGAPLFVGGLVLLSRRRAPAEPS